MIYIHRPFISQRRRGSHAFSPSTLERSYLHARKICIDSAVAISTLLRIYRRTCTLRYTNVEVVSIIFSAAIILVLESVAGPASQSTEGRGLPARGDDSVAAHLDTCCKALADLGRVFHNATRTLEVLLAIKRKWQAELLASTGSKRRSSTVSRPAMKKRTLSHPNVYGVAV